jgi:hypothetical protein
MSTSNEELDYVSFVTFLERFCTFLIQGNKTGLCFIFLIIDYFHVSIILHLEIILIKPPNFLKDSRQVGVILRIIIVWF